MNQYNDCPHCPGDSCAICKNYNYTWDSYMHKKLIKLEDKIKELEQNIEKSTTSCMDAINIEDKITASDVLCRLTMVESRVEECEKFQNVTDNQYKSLINNKKTPHKCPVCYGEGIRKDLPKGPYLYKYPLCDSCLATGVVWG